MQTRKISACQLHVARAWRIALGVLALAGVQLALLTACAAAPAPKLTISVEPFESGKIVYLPLAAPTQGKPVTARLFLRLLITNGEASKITLDTLTLTFSGPPQVPLVQREIHWRQQDGSYMPAQIDAGKAGAWWFQNASDEIILPIAAPTSVTLAISAKGFSSSASVTLPLTAHQSPTPQGSYLFPAHASDLRVGEYWCTEGDTHAMGTQGRQSFAYDLGVAVPGQGKCWKTQLLPGGDSTKNSDYRIWGKPIYAMADGTVLEGVDGVPTNPKPITAWKDQADLDAQFAEQKAKYWGSYTNGGAGNHFYIQHGDEVALYAHMQPGTLPAKLLTKGAVVKAGQFLGLAGNAGNSTAPHLHIHVVKGTQPEQGPLRPLLFRDAYAINLAALNPPDPSGPWFKLTGHGIPPVTAAIWPAATPPSWVPPGWQEVAFHGVPEAQYQTKFDQITSSGYRPVWVDGYEINGQTYFNAIFRPANGVATLARHGLSAADYQTEFDKWTKQEGYHPLQVESYLSGGGVRYAAIFVKGAGPQFSAYHGKTAIEHQRLFNALSLQGYVAVNISAVTVAGARFYTALYEQRNVGAWEAHDFLTLAEYQTTFHANVTAGRRLVFVDAYAYLGSPRIAAIWYQTAPSAAARHGMSSDQYQQEYDKKLGAGLLTRAVAGYEENGQQRFAAFWTK